MSPVITDQPALRGVARITGGCYRFDRLGDTSAMSLDIAEGARPAVRIVDT